MKIPSKIILTHLQFYKKIPFNFSRKKIDPKIWSQNYPLEPTS